jgi:hypothetical protein
VAGGGEAGHVDPDLGDYAGGGGAADAVDLVEPAHRLGERGDQLLDLGVQRGDVGVDGTGPGQHPPQQKGVVVGEVPGERLFQGGQLGPHPALGQLRQRFGVALPSDQRRHHRPPGDPKMSEATTPSLMQASSSSFSARCFSAVRAADLNARQRHRASPRPYTGVSD